MTKILTLEHTDTYSKAVFGGHALFSDYFVETRCTDTQESNTYKVTTRWRGIESLDAQWDVSNVVLPEVSNSSTLTTEAVTDLVESNYL